MVVHQYTRHIFGAKDSPTCANYALQQTGRDNENDFPDAARAITENFYMDDYLGCTASIEETVNRCKELITVLKKGGFKLTKFVSNCPEVLNLIHAFENTQGQVTETNPETTKTIGSSAALPVSSHVLGLKWDHQAETLVVNRAN